MSDLIGRFFLTVMGALIISLPVAGAVWVIQATSFWVIVPIITLLLSFMPSPQAWTDANDKATEARKARDERR